MSKIVVVNSSDTFEYRINLLYKVLKEMGHEVKVIASNFMHIEKKQRNESKEDYIYLHTVSYKKNISFIRLWSHYKFAKDAEKYLKEMEFDILYLVVPPNSQAKIARKYYRNPNVKIVIDIIDLWPESLPTKLTKYFPFTLWRDVRNHNLKYADKIITECNLYQYVLSKYLAGKDVETIYWAHDEKELPEIKPNLSEDEIHLCYLGSINNIIDISKIGEIIQTIKNEKPVVLKIIGDGEKRQELIETAKSAGAEVVYYGKVYDTMEKQKIFDTCHYGLNIMKDTVCVGLSMKSIDYWEGGLPIINNLRGDTYNLVEKERLGVNWESIDGSVILHNSNIDRTGIRESYSKYFSFKSYKNAIKLKKW